MLFFLEDDLLVGLGLRVAFSVISSNHFAISAFTTFLDDISLFLKIIFLFSESLDDNPSSGGTKIGLGLNFLSFETSFLLGR